MQVEFYDGLRVTDDEAMEVVKMVLVGKVNTELVSAINRHGRLAVGISGDDGNLSARPISRASSAAWAMSTAIDTTVVDRPDRRRLHPGDRHGRPLATTAASYNVNADLVAGELAAALGAAKVIFLTDVDGLYARPRATEPRSSARSRLQRGGGAHRERQLGGGMIPKVAACAQALRGGVERAHILNGTRAARAAARGLHGRRRRHDDHADGCRTGRA